jgi:RHS repeat-associated protein
LFTYYTSGPERGLPETVKDGRGVTHRTLYDSVLRPSSQESAGGNASGGGGGLLRRTWQYDREGQLLRAGQEGGGQAATMVTRTHDAYGRQRTEETQTGGALHVRFTQDWDGAGRRTVLNATTGGGATRYDYGYRADGALARVSSSSGAVAQTYTYGAGGLLQERRSARRVWKTEERDVAGRPVTVSTEAGGERFVEMLEWNADTRLSAYRTSTRQPSPVGAQWRSYGYDARGRLVSEAGVPRSSHGGPVTVAYGFDGGAGVENKGPGVRTQLKAGGAGGRLEWSVETQAGGVDGFGRVKEERVDGGGRGIEASGYAPGARAVEVSLDGVAVPGVQFGGWADAQGRWSVTLENVTAGEHTLDAQAVHPSGKYTAQAQSHFTVAEKGVRTEYDGAGNVTKREWLDGRVQTLAWDALGRLARVVERDGSGSGNEWRADYDALGRRIRTYTQPLEAGVPTGTVRTESSYYDPQVEFLEVGVALGSAVAWKVYGADEDGGFGGRQGLGALEAVVCGTAVAEPVQDIWGHVVGLMRSGASVIEWSQERCGSYGLLPGSVNIIPQQAAELVASLVWRGKRADVTGFYYFGARYYEPEGGRFLSADPAGHGASMTLYDFAGGDPVNGFDPDGRLASSMWTNFSSISTSSDSVFGSLFNTFRYQAQRNKQFWNETGIGQALRMLPGVDGFAQLTSGNIAGAAFSWGVDVIGLAFGGAGLAGKSLVANSITLGARSLVRSSGQIVAQNVARQAAIQATHNRVIANIAESQIARNVSNFGKAAERIPTHTRTFQGLEVRAVRDLGHVDDATLRAMADKGFAARTVNGDKIVLHHHQQNPAGFIVEVPAPNHSIGNVRQHPFGNTAGAGLSAEQRAAFDTWRGDYWRMRAQEELSRRASGGTP